MEGEGWIKLHRRFLEWEWFDNDGMVRIFVALLLMANHEDRKWHEETISRGQVLTSRDKLAKATGLSEQQVRTCLSRLKSNQQITSKSTNKNTIITISDYDRYVVDGKGDQPANPQQIPSKQPANPQQINQQIPNKKRGATDCECGEYENSGKLNQPANNQQNNQQTTSHNNIYYTGSSIVSSSSVDKSTPEESTISEPRPTMMSDAASAGDVLTNRHCQNIADFWNKTVLETNSTLPQVRALSEERKKKIRVRWKEFSTVGDPVEVCRVVFRNVCSSFFCQGGGRSGWTASFDWVFSNGQNWVKAYEGEYDNKPAPHARQQAAPKTRLEQAEDNMKFIDDFFNGKQSNTAPDEQ